MDHPLETDGQLIYRFNPVENRWEFWCDGWTPSLTFLGGSEEREYIRDGGDCIATYLATEIEPLRGML